MVMRLCPPVVLSYLHAGFEPGCGGKDFLTACLLAAAACCLLLARCLLKCVAHPWTLRRGVKPRRGKPSSVIKPRTRMSRVLVFRNALEIPVEERPLALEMCLHSPDDPFLDTKSAVERARRVKTARNLFLVMRIGSLIVLNDYAGFEPRFRRKDFLIACLLLAAWCC